jgi:predicted site-specific integrase-resolvase
MKLSHYAKQKGISYQTAWRMFKRGELNAEQLATGTIIVNEERQSINLDNKVAIYARVSSTENKFNLDSQSARLEAYCTAKGYQIIRIVKEVGSGVNDSRQKLIKLLEQTDYKLIVVEHKDRLTRVGFNYLKLLLTQTGRDIEVVNLAEERKDDLMPDFVSIITSFCARLYSLRRRTRQTERLINCLKENNNEVNSEAFN